MIQEVISVEAELQLLRFGEPEVFVKAEIAVEERRPEYFRSHDGSIAPRRCRQRKAVSVDELIVAEPRARIASHQRPQRNRVRPIDAAGADGIAARELRAVRIQVEVAAGIGGQVWAGLA